MDIKDLTKAEAKKEFDSKRVSGKYQEVFDRVAKDKVSVKVSGLTRGQVAALYRKAKESGLKYRTNYKELYVVISPADET